MDIIERREKDVVVDVTNALGGKFKVFDADGEEIKTLEVPEGQMAVLSVPYGGIVKATYTGQGNEDTLYVGGNDPTSIRKAATRRFPGLSVGV